jgi:hypothetical protein
MKKLNLVGQKFGRLEVKEFAGISKNGNSIWDCLCDCGNITRVLGNNLKTGNTKSCGCLNKERAVETKTIHGQAKKGQVSRGYICWHNMKERCYNPNDKSYKNYGGRGIKVCDRWLSSFENFYEDMGDCPKGLSLDRKDNDGDYTPENCRWSTNEEQRSNTRRSAWLKHEGETDTITRWARSKDMKVATLANRLNVYGWSIERALTTPVRR